MCTHMTDRFTYNKRLAHQAVYREVFVQSESPRLTIALMYEDNELTGLSPIDERSYGEHDDIFEAMGLEYRQHNAAEVAKEVIKVMVEDDAYSLNIQTDSVENDKHHWPQFKHQLEEAQDIEALELVEKAENGELVL